MLLSSVLLACLEATPAGAPSCTDCHSGQSSEAPFEAAGGVTDPTARTVGAHTAHLWEPRWSKRAVCTDCHPAYGAVDAEGHLDPDGPTLPADVSWASSEIASGDPYDAGGLTCTVSCHGADAGAAPVWTDPATTVCGSCHGLPPTADHPQTGAPCTVCHAAATPEWEHGDPEAHVDGATSATALCSDCHGDANSPAPSSGAHVAHDVGTGRSARVGCVDCHLVPATADDGHDDGGRAEVVLSGYDAADRTCETSCHTQPGGSDPAPAWTDGPLTCTGCHSVPPPSPHPGNSACEECHPDAGPDQTIASPADHVNGTVDL